MTVDAVEPRSDVVDTLIDVYCDWREECMALRLAYERWATVPVADRDLAFAAYRAALDREESASRVYADQISRVHADYAPQGGV